MTEDLSKYTELTDVNFDFEGSHLAIVHKTQGGAANGVHYALITKATNDIDESILDEIIEKDFSRAKVSMRLDDFLSYFKKLPETEQEDAFYHYEQRAEGMVPVLNESFFQDRINDMDFMKSMSLEDISKLTEEQKLKIKLFQSEFENGLLSGNNNSPDEGKNKDDVNKSNNSSNNTQNKGENVNMSEKDNKELEDLVKSLQAQVDTFKAAEDKRKEEDLKKAVKGFEFIAEEEVDSIASVLKALDSEKQDSLLAVLAKANSDLVEAKENAEMFVQKSASGESEYAPEEALVAKVKKSLGINKKD